MNAAVFHLSKHPSSVKQMSRVLLRKSQRVMREELTKKKDPEKRTTPEAAKAAVDQVIERLIRAGYLDDERLAENKAGSLRRSGKSSRLIAMKLTQKGLDRTLVAKHSKTTAEEEEDAAWILARKKRLGPYSREVISKPSLRGKPPKTPREIRQKQIATMCRAGFSFQLAKRIIESTEPRDP